MYGLEVPPLELGIHIGLGMGAAHRRQRDLHIELAYGTAEGGHSLHITRLKFVLAGRFVTAEGVKTLHRLVNTA